MNNLIRIAAGALFVLALLLAGYGIFLSSKPTAAPMASAVESKPLFKTVVVSRALAAGHVLAESDLRTEAFPTAIDGAYTNTTELVGKHLSIAVNAGTPVLASFVGQRFAYDVPAGQRAVAIRVDETIGVGHQIQPGDTVDLFVVLKQAGQEIATSGARLLLSQLQVLAYGQQVHAGGSGGITVTTDASPARTEPARMAVLAVPVEDVAQLLLAEGSGRLAMALRNPEDTGRPTSGQWTFASVLPAKPGANTSAEDKAFTGVRLDSLSGGPVGRSTTTVRAPGLAVAVPQVVAPSGTAAARAGASERRTIEVIRAGKRENAPY